MKGFGIHCHSPSRGTLRRRLEDFTAAIEDLVSAIELSESVREDALGERQEGSEKLREEAHAQLVLTYNDFAVHCFSRGFYTEASMLLSKAIEDQRDESGLFINRGGEDMDRQASTLFKHRLSCYRVQVK